MPSKPHSELFETVRFPLDHPIGRSLGELSDAKRALRNIEEQLEAAQERLTALNQIREVADDSRMSDEFVGNVARSALSRVSIPAKESE